MTGKEFHNWFQSLDLGALEPHRDRIIASALANSQDTEVAIASNDWDYDCAMQTVEVILDDPSCIGL